MTFHKYRFLYIIGARGMTSYWALVNCVMSLRGGFSAVHRTGFTFIFTYFKIFTPKRCRCIIILLDKNRL